MKTILTRIKIQHISNTEEKSMCSSLRVQIYTMQINGYDWLPHQTTSDCTGPTSDQRRAMFFENWLQPVVLTPSDPWGAILTLSDPRGMVLTLKPGRQESRHWPKPVTKSAAILSTLSVICHRFVGSRLSPAHSTMSTVSRSTLSPNLNTFNLVESGWFLSPQCRTSFSLCWHYVRPTSLTFDKVHRVEFNSVASVYRA